jgi:signal transduction histidine kinase
VSDSSSSLWWIFLAGVLAVAILLTAFGIALVIYQRRYVAMHRAYTRRLLTAQEEERAWVAREVHDDALQRIALIRHECEVILASAPPITAEQQGKLGGVGQELGDLSAFLRTIAHRLHPSLIDQAGLRAALAGLPGELQRGYGLAVESRIPDEPIPMEPERALAIYRIAQEALRNVATHAGVRTAVLECRRNGAGLEIIVTDPGQGFDPRLEHRTRGLGLTGMRERAHLAGGTLTIASRPGGGTTVRARFPDRPAAAS